MNLILLVGPICGWLGAKDWNPPLVNIYAVTSILWFFFAVALFGWFLYLGITDKWRRYFVSSVTPGWFWFSVFWQALWALVRLLIANIVRSSVPFTRDVERDVNAVDARPRRRRETPNAVAGGQVRPAPPDHRPAEDERGRAAGPPRRTRVLLSN